MSSLWETFIDCMKEPFNRPTPSEIVSRHQPINDPSFMLLLAMLRSLSPRPKKKLGFLAWHTIIVLISLAIVMTSLWLFGNWIMSLPGANVALIMYVVFLYLYAIWMMLVPIWQGMSAIIDPCNDLMQEQDRRLAKSVQMIAKLDSMDFPNARLRLKYLTSFMNRLYRQQQVVRGIIIGSPILGLLIDHLARADWDQLFDTPLMLYPACFMVGILIGWMRMSSVLRELSDLQFALAHCRHTEQQFEGGHASENSQ
ncbi:hypothetical protein [Halomonas salipaludis]|uniref:Uncharacterized protein n=1 Tax=Halomonas salipaludis TaxID=2032625 RepID=A0A2A2F499_9GAMM|nr:hypothetical protein [Halomonas salipaludis]PAU79432.1 hypothetical protein CK498_03440 [Halomonas salipaludis]